MTTTYIAFANQKGGVAKTTSTLSIGHGLALQGYKTLIVDLDPQGHIAKMLNLPKAPGVRRWYYDEEPIAACVIEARPNLDILPADKTIERVQGKIRDDAAYGRNGPLEFARALRRETANYAVVLIDLAPSLNPLQVAALLAANYAIIPTRLRITDMDGVTEVLKTITELNRQGSPLSYFILPTFYDRSTTETANRFKEMITQFGKKLWPPVVQDTRISEAPGHGQTVWEYAPDCNGLLGYVNGGGKRVGGYAYAVNQVINLIEGV